MRRVRFYETRGEPPSTPPRAAPLTSPQVFAEVCAPLLAMKRSAMICISTLRGADNHYTAMTRRFIDMEKEGERSPFRIMSVDMICDTCRESAHPENCRHTNPDDIPPWQSSENRQTASLLIQGSGDHAALVGREMLGVSCDSLERAFERDSVWKLFNNPRTPPPPHPTNLVVGVDPNGGGSSMMAITTLLKDSCQPFAMVSPPLITPPDKGRVSKNSKQQRRAQTAYRRT